MPMAYTLKPSAEPVTPTGGASCLRSEAECTKGVKYETTGEWEVV
jgi:hypothetical protein